MESNNHPFYYRYYKWQLHSTCNKFQRSECKFISRSGDCQQHNDRTCNLHSERSHFILYRCGNVTLTSSTAGALSLVRQQLLSQSPSALPKLHCTCDNRRLCLQLHRYYGQHYYYSCNSDCHSRGVLPNICPVAHYTHIIRRQWIFVVERLQPVPSLLDREPG